MAVISGENSDDHVDPPGGQARPPRYMHTSAQLTEDGVLHATTRTWTDILLSGFHGSVKVLLVNAQGDCVDVSPVHVYGVDGKWIGTHDRTDTWTANFDPKVAASTASLKFVHSWDPQWLQSIQNTVQWIGVLIDMIIKAIVQSGKGNVS
ncbi:hypothetical protein [Streptomyces sp. NPDC086766]|uniref:hypothetical protein n=1 Tax=Streptomyces sp. NPDC086766 TaxID=3365754 RepID=UPI00382CE721